MEKKKVWMVKTKVGRMRAIVLALGPTSFLSSLFCDTLNNLVFDYAGLMCVLC